jgi:type IV secretion system protein VirB6
VVSRILLALLLALTPVMAGFLLFDATRGILEGWLRALTAAAIVPLFVFVLCAIELAMLSPLLDRMLADQARDRFELDTVTPVALVVIVFSIAIVASARAAATIARGIRLPRNGYDSDVAGTSVPTATVSTEAGRTGPRTGASPVARALESAARRDSKASARGSFAAALMRGSLGAPAVIPAGAARSTPGSPASFAPATGAATRSPRTRLPRASRAAARRDS